MEVHFKPHKCVKPNDEAENEKTVEGVKLIEYLMDMIELSDELPEGVGVFIGVAVYFDNEHALVKKDLFVDSTKTIYTVVNGARNQLSKHLDIRYIVLP